MPTRLVMGSCCRRKTVILQVYVERPRGVINRLTPNHLHQHTTTHQRDRIIKCKHGISIKAYNRKADLLHYVRRFHEPTQSRSTPLLAREEDSSTNQHQHAPKVVNLKKKPSNSKRTPTSNCLGNNKVFAPKFLASLMKFGEKKEKTNCGGGSFGKKMKVIVKKIEEQRRCRFFEKLLGALRKPRS